MSGSDNREDGLSKYQHACVCVTCRLLIIYAVFNECAINGEGRLVTGDTANYGEFVYIIKKKK